MSKGTDLNHLVLLSTNEEEKWTNNIAAIRVFESNAVDGSSIQDLFTLSSSLLKRWLTLAGKI